jgi:DNA-binding transcriptional LysR family regulator
MNIDYMFTFQRLAREKSFSETAILLSVSQSTVTQRIKDLEMLVGKVLVHRTGQYISLTDAGEDLLIYIDRILEVLEKGKGAMQSSKSSTIPKIHVATTSSICSYFLPPFWERWHLMYPESPVLLSSRQTHQVINMVKDKVAEVGIVRGAIFDSPLESTILYYDPIYLVTGPNHPLSDHPRDIPIQLAQLTHEPILAYRSNSWSIVNQLFISKGIVPHVIAELSHVITVKKLIETGFGIAFLPYSTIKSEQSNSRLKCFQVNELRSLTLPTQAIYLSSIFSNSSSLPFFLQELKESASSFPLSDSSLDLY